MSAMHRLDDPDTQEMILASPRARRIAICLLLVALLLVLGAGFALLVRPGLQATLEATPSPQAINLLKYGFCALAALVTLLAAMLMINGWRVIRLQQSPLPGAMVWRDTPIRRGARARRAGIGYLAIGLASCVLGVGLGVYIWNVLQQAGAPLALKLPPGVVILRQNGPGLR